MEVPCRLWGPQPVAAFQCCCLLQRRLPLPCCMALVSREGTCLPGTDSTSAQHPGSSATCYTQALPTLSEKRHQALPTTGWSHGGRPADLEPRSVIWYHHCAHSSFLLRVGSNCCRPPLSLTMTLPWTQCQSPGGEGITSEPQGLGSLRQASLPLPAPSTISRGEAGGHIPGLYGRGLHRAIPSCNPGRVGFAAWSWPQQGPVYEIGRAHV